MSLLTKFFGTKNDKDLKKLIPIVISVNENEQWAKSLKDEEFPVQTQKFKEMLKSKDLTSKEQTLFSILPKAFALAREASYRVLGERHYDVQIMGAIVLFQGKILELKTGEGKTLTAVPAAYLNALTQEGVHIVTVNDYLAQRDSQWMGAVYKFLGLTTGVILSNMDNSRRREAYKCDITYGTNNEFGFDYLRDNMQTRVEDRIQINHSYCIIDEIDSILIDEARTPLIISGHSDDDTQFALNAEKISSFFKECEKDPQTGDYPVISAFARFEEGAKTEPEGDFMLDEKSKRVTFTKDGMIRMEQLLQKMNIITGSLYDDENFEYVHYVTQALVAKYLYKKDTDYVVSDNQIQIVDEFTGRILYGRRYSNGLHQAIEAKEHIKVLGKNKTLATITFQNFFRMYKKLSGMTGTADTEAYEFNSIYNLDVVVVPTNVPVQRKDLNDLVFLNEKFKFRAICDEIKRVHETGQPILIGTVSIEKSELLSSMIRKMGIKHEVLNAKNHAREAAIIENAGAVGAVTIATNMAGRGTDIKLGGSIDSMIRRICPSDSSEEERKKAKEKVKIQWQKEYEKVKNLGGLYILGTERHESRRIDNQLRGRSGRQGDPGVSRFFVSFEDTLLRLFAKENIISIMSRLGMNNGEPIESPMISKVIENAQKRVEERNFEIRKHLLEYDDVLNEQRIFIYNQRNEILTDPNIIERSYNACCNLIDDLAEQTESVDLFISNLPDKIGFDYNPTKEEKLSDLTNISSNVKSSVKKILDEKVNQVGVQIFSIFVRNIYLRQIDLHWQNHLEQLEALRDSVSLRTFAQKNPLLEYKLEGFDIFDEMIYQIKTNVVKTVNRVKITKEHEYKKTEKKTSESHANINSFSSERTITNQEQTSPVQIIRTSPKIGRNAPCPCGSGLKYKKCCGKLL